MTTWQGTVRMTVAALAALLLGACSVSTTVSVSSSAPAQVQHLYITVTGVWLNTSATAATTATGWVGQELNTPMSVDLASLDAGTVTDLVSGIKTPPGTYRQLRLVLADAADPLSSAAEGAALTWNAQVQYLNSAGTSVTLPLELPNRSSDLVVPATIALSGSGVGPFIGASSGRNSTQSAATVSSTPTNSSTTSTGTSTTVVADVAVNVEAVRHLLLFEYGNTTAALLDPRLSAVNAAKAGAISGTLDVSAVAAGVLTGTQGVVVTAERLSDDGTRYEAVKSVPVSTGGAFTLYPLPVADTGPTTYELVIHGPGIRTQIISAVPVSAGAAADATVIQSSSLPLVSAKSFTVNTAANSAPLPGGSTVGFYQTIPGFSASHLVEYETPDPFNGGFFANVTLSADAIDYGIYASGSPVSFSTATPVEGIGTYRIGAFAPLRAGSSLSNTVSAPTVSTSAAQPVFLPAPGASVGGGTLGANGTINLGGAGRFDRGFVLISSGGELIDAVNLQASLSGASASANFTLSGLPGGNGAPYEVTTRLWNSKDPAGTLVRTAAASTLNPAIGGTQSVSITVP
ncbi:MAG: DUF4382 domain-containing protein [Proteobacteria bacterium]|nr:DUF4382 domain-containing protein [Pseudomonadota bacterium]